MCRKSFLKYSLSYNLLKMILKVSSNYLYIFNIIISVAFHFSKITISLNFSIIFTLWKVFPQIVPLNYFKPEIEIKMRPKSSEVENFQHSSIQFIFRLLSFFTCLLKRFPNLELRGQKWWNFKGRGEIRHYLEGQILRNGKYRFHWFKGEYVLSNKHMEIFVK